MKSSMPYFDPSRPIPDSLTPPNGATSFEMIPSLTPTIPYSSPTAPYGGFLAFPFGSCGCTGTPAETSCNHRLNLQQGSRGTGRHGATAGRRWTPEEDRALFNAGVMPRAG